MTCIFLCSHCVDLPISHFQTQDMNMFLLVTSNTRNSVLPIFKCHLIPVSVAALDKGAFFLHLSLAALASGGL